MKEDYTDQDILTYWNNNYTVLKTRKRIYIDPRNYIIALLYCKFGYVEEELADIFKVHRTSINYAKRTPYNFIEHEDNHFIENTKKLREEFPYVFPRIEDVPYIRLYPIIPRITRHAFIKLKRHASKKQRKTNQVAADIIMDYLDKWVK